MRRFRLPGSRRRLSLATRWFLSGVVTLVVFATAPLTSQGSLSEQVLRLLTRNNYWSGTQTFARTVGVTLESGLTPPVIPANTLYNLGGNLYFNGVLVATSSGVGTVTSVGLDLPTSLFDVTVSPIVSTGALTAVFVDQDQGFVFAGPASGGSGQPTFRALASTDLPALPAGDITGVVAVANGGTGLSAGNSGGIPYFDSTGSMASSATLTADRILLGGGAGASPTFVSNAGTTGQVLLGQTGAPVFGTLAIANTTGTLAVSRGGTGLTTGVSGGVLGYTATGTLSASVLLTQHALVVGGGAGATPTPLASLGTTTTVLHGNASGAPTWSALDLAADVTGTLPATNGGTGLATYAQGDLLYASAADTLAALAKSTTATRYLANTGTDNAPVWDQIDLSNGVTGTLLPGQGGTGATATPSNGQIPIGNGSTFAIAAITGTANQVTVTNGAGTITLALPQAINTTATPQFARLGLGTGAHASAVLNTTGQFNLGLVGVSCGASTTLDWLSGTQRNVTLTDTTCTFTFSNPITGAPPYTVVLVQDGSGGRLVAWPASVVWEGGTPPVLSTSPGDIDVCRFLWNGTNYLGSCTLGYA